MVVSTIQTCWLIRNELFKRKRNVSHNSLGAGARCVFEGTYVVAFGMKYWTYNSALQNWYLVYILPIQYWANCKVLDIIKRENFKILMNWVLFTLSYYFNKLYTLFSVSIERPLWANTRLFSEQVDLARPLRFMSNRVKGKTMTS